ncbi:hypothetical protein TrRE_jg4451 [Triparma retinervis]|uniref:Uncharacterized protein n=1 Tax=Triparma retinervis TaxID=2557542 RepID=A0A9W7G940_9STRA|nr:hypothetical protein TrRE_jg4451 [Triparma retinervis]
MSGFSQPIPSSISDDVREAGASIGIDVDKLRKKYLTTKLTANLAAGGSEDQLKVKQQLEDAARMRTLEANAGADSALTSGQADEKKEEIKRRLDKLVVCSRCNGQGLVKESYNFQVKDKNCDECEAEGILYKDPETGRLLKHSEAPAVDPSAYNIDKDELEKKARELAETTGLSSSAGLKETDLDIPPALM